MAIYSDGFNTYVQRKGGWELVTPESSGVSINGKQLYRFDKKTGVLELSVPPSELEALVANYKDIPAEGIAVTFSMPPLGEQYFEGVKSFKSLLDADGNYLAGTSSDAVNTPAAEEPILKDAQGVPFTGYPMDIIAANAPPKSIVTPSLYERVKDRIKRFF